MKLTAIKNNIIFKFVEGVNSSGEFEKTETASIIHQLANFDESAKDPRWVKIVSVGPDCTFVKEGMQVLLPALRWTNSTKFDGERIWKSDETQVVAWRVPGIKEVYPVDGVVIFKHVHLKASSSIAGLTIYGGVVDSPKGIAVYVGSKCEPELVGSTIWYDGTNFLDTFTSSGVEMAFIKETDILLYEKNTEI